MSILEEALGLTETHLTELSCKSLLNKQVEDDFVAMKNAAATDGVSLDIASSYRSLDRQRSIWNGKFSGQRPCYNTNNELLDLNGMTEQQKVSSILLFSAIPGFSRHHWGSDIDVFDKNAMTPNYQLQLTAAEYGESGPFHNLRLWLQNHAEQFGFFFPYQNQGPIAFEPWHLSHQSTAEQYLSAFDRHLADICHLLAQQDIAGWAHISSNFEQLAYKYVLSYRN